MRQGLSEPEFYDDLVYKLKKIVGSNNFSAQFIKIISYNINVLQRTACLVVNPITANNFVSSLIALHAGGSYFRLNEGSDLKTYLLMRWVGADALAVVRPTWGCLRFVIVVFPDHTHILFLPVGFILLRYSVLFYC